MRKRTVISLLALGALAVAAVGAVRWKDIAARFQVLRLAGNKNLQDSWLERPADSIEGRALRAYYRERPDELIRTVFRTVPLALSRGENDRLSALKDLESLDRVSATLTMETPDREGSIRPGMISLQFG